MPKAVQSIALKQYGTLISSAGLEVAWSLCRMTFVLPVPKQPVTKQ